MSIVLHLDIFLNVLPKLGRTPYFPSINKRKTKLDSFLRAGAIAPKGKHVFRITSFLLKYILKKRPGKAKVSFLSL